MGIIEGNKIIFKSCFFQAFEGNPCCIDTQCRCTCMCRNTFGIDGQGSFFFVLQESQTALTTNPPFMEMIFVFLE